MGLEANVGLTIVAHESATEALTDVFRVTNVNYAASYTDGTGANQAQLVWGITATCGTSAVQYDLRSLPSDRGNVTVTAAKVCYVKNLSSNVHISLSAPAGLTPFPGFPRTALDVHEGGVYAVVATDAGGYNAVSAFQAQVAATAGTAAFQFILIGEGTAP